MAPIISRLSSLGGGGTGGFSFGKRRTVGGSAESPPVLAYSLTSQQNFNGSNYYDFNLTSNPVDLSGSVSVLCWAYVSSSQSEGGGNQSGVIWNSLPPGYSFQYDGMAVSFSKGSYGWYLGGWGTTVNPSVQIPRDQWCHIAWIRDSNLQVRLYLNGTKIGDPSDPGYWPNTAYQGSLNCPFRLAYSINQYTYSTNGSITDFFVYKNRTYTANFTPPTRGGGTPF